MSLVEKECTRHHQLLYNSIDDGPVNSYVNPGSVFMSQFNDHKVPTVIDTGASRSLTPFRSDFVKFTNQQSSISGIGSDSQVEGFGTVRWKIIDENGTIQSIETEAYYVPTAHIRLYSPQSHFKECNDGSLHITGTSCTLQLPQQKQAMSFPFNHFNNLPLMIQAPSDTQAASALILESTIPTSSSGSFYHTDFAHDAPYEATFFPDMQTTDITSALETEQCGLCAITDEKNVNLQSSQLELLSWHQKLGHVGMHSIQRLMHPTKSLDNRDISSQLTHPVVIQTKHAKTHRCTPPKCAACILGKMENIPKSTTQTHGSTNGGLSDGALYPGDRISTDQYIVTQKGRTISNSSKDNLKINGGTIFVDHASGRIFAHHQISLRAGETIIGKRLLERDAKSNGITIKSFQADNGVFASKEFKDDVTRKNQTIHFSGVGAKHQNGTAERTIKTISYLTRAQLLHAALRWPAQNNLELWPFAFDHSIYIWNNLPSADGLSPEEKWSGSKFHDFDHLRRLHPWGCPVFVLDPKLQDGKKLPKWQPRSRQGKFIGFSKLHSSSVGLILNPNTKRISPQYHVVYDDYFTTVRSVDDSTDPVISSNTW
jgi:hypothetical protein